MNKTTFTNLFARFDRENASKYRAQRSAARERFAAMDWPTPRNEDWRFTNVGPVVDNEYELPDSELTVNLKRLPPRPAPSTIRLVFANGRMMKELSAVGSLPRGVQVASLADPGIKPTQLGQMAGDADSIFTALNTGFLNEGAYITVPDGVALEAPIDILWLSQSGSKTTATHPRVLVQIGKHAQATIVERYLGDGEYLTNAVTEIAIAESGLCDHVKVQQESADAFHIATTQVVLAGRSNFTTHYLGFGGDLVRNEVRVRFNGEHAEATVNGLYMATGTQHLDNFTVIDHAMPNCASHELYKGILNDRSHGVFNGKIFVRKDAQKTDAKQTNKVLLLSDDATINTKPQLEIFADDVKCTHGATVGQLDANQMFYLQSRGIPLAQAQRLLTFAFANDIVSRVKLEAIRNELEARIVR